MHIYGSLKKISGILFSSVEFKTALKKDIEISLLQKNLFKNKIQSRNKLPHIGLKKIAPLNFIQLLFLFLVLNS